ncbi:MAG: UbiA family prenyltransferase [Planctomycetota bacterium]|jgi:4-hydroxybenzoate polyprenyltransferase|nr:UbiA family prenyltransferase [Planctomycetota bacterium]
MMLDWLRLTRASGLFTVASNYLAAVAAAIYTKSLDYSLLGRELRENLPNAVWIVVASCLLFLSGMLWNDVADADRDRVLHPGRPLASGRIHLGTAWIAGLFLSSGALLAAAQSGYRGLCAAGVVLCLSLIYNFATKSVPYLGSLTMALVRASHAIFALLILGTAYFDRSVLSLLDLVMPIHPGALGGHSVYPLLLGSYILGLTVISELESRRGMRWELLFGGILVAVSLVFALRMGLTAHWVNLLHRQRHTVLLILALVLVLALAALLAWRVGRPYLDALRTAKRRHVGKVVGAGLGGMILFDALIATAFHPLIGLAALMLFIPNRLAVRLVRMD